VREDGRIYIDFDAWFQFPSFLVDGEVAQYLSHEEFRLIVYVFRNRGHYLSLSELETPSTKTKQEICKVMQMDEETLLALLQSLVAIGFLEYGYAPDAQINLWGFAEDLNEQILMDRDLKSREWAWFVKAQNSKHNFSKDIIPVDKPTVVKQQYTYLMSGAPSLYKIGWTTNPKSRLSKMGGQAYPVKYVCLIKTDNGLALEQELHQRFASKRMRDQAEWFRLAVEDVEYIKSLAVES
jgi:hypothetical protein